MTADLTNERLRQIIEAAGKATPGPWRRYAKSPYVSRDATRPDPYPDVGSVLIAECGNYKDKELVPFNMDRWLADATHIANCDPATITAMAGEVLRLREALQHYACKCAATVGDCAPSERDFSDCGYRARQALAATPYRRPE